MAIGARMDMSIRRSTERAFIWVTDHWHWILVGLLGIYVLAAICIVLAGSVSLPVAGFRIWRVLANELPPPTALEACGAQSSTLASIPLYVVWFAGWVIVPVTVGMVAARADRRRLVVEEARRKFEQAIRDFVKEEFGEDGLRRLDRPDWAKRFKRMLAGWT